MRGYTQVSVWAIDTLLERFIIIHEYDVAIHEKMNK